MARSLCDVGPLIWVVYVFKAGNHLIGEVRFLVLCTCRSSPGKGSKGSVRCKSGRVLFNYLLPIMMFIVLSY